MQNIILVQKNQTMAKADSAERVTETWHTIKTLVGVLLLAAPLTFLSACGQAEEGKNQTNQEQGQKRTDTVPVKDLMQPSDLAELTLGPDDAKVTIVEYASMTCGHCARFHDEVFPELKKKYIDTNKVRFVMREFPLDDLAAAASMLARCSGDDKAFPLISALFKSQQTWAYSQGSPLPKLFDIAKQAGFTKTKFDECLKDEKLLGSIKKIRERADKVFGVNSTPTFFVNGQRLKGSISLEQFDKVIEPLLASK